MLTYCFVIHILPCFITHDIVDCEWNVWSVGTCTKTCGAGARINTRTKKVSAENGGKNCEGSSTVQEGCNNQECPGYINVYFEWVV